MMTSVRVNTKKAALMLLMVVLTLMLVFPAHAAKTKLNRKSVKITVGQSLRLKVKNAKKKVRWRSTNTRIVQVDRKGLVTGINKGSAKIIATVGKKKLTCKVKVMPGIVKRGSVSSNQINYNVKLDGTYLEVEIQNHNSNAISLGWTGDFQVTYYTTAGVYTAGMDALNSLQNTGNLRFNQIPAGSTSFFYADLSTLKGTLKSIRLDRIYQLKSNGLPEFDWNTFSSVMYSAVIDLK